MEDNPLIIHPLKKEFPFRRTSLLQQITEDDLRTEIMRRIYRRIAINSSLENFSHADVGDAKVYYQSRDRAEADKVEFNVEF